MGVLAAAIGVTAQLAHLLPGVQSDSVALRFQAHDAKTPSNVVVVGIDDVTFSDLRRQWPFPRRMHARAIDRLKAAGAKTIVYDVQFTEPTTERDDTALYDAVARAGNVVLATSETDSKGRTNVLGGDANLAAAHAVAAASNLPTGPGGVFQKFTHSAVGIDTLAIAAAKRSGATVPAPSDFPPGGAWIDYAGGPGTGRTVSFSDLYDGKVDPAVFRGKIVVVGARSPSLQAVHATPAASHSVISGAEIQANAIRTATRGLPLRTAPLWFDLLAIVLLALTPALAGLRARPLAIALVAPLVGIGWIALAQVAFGAGWIVAVVWPLAALLMGTTGTIAARYLAELGERRRVTVYSELLERRVHERTEELRETQLEAVRRLEQAAASRAGDTRRHIARVARRAPRPPHRAHEPARRAPGARAWLERRRRRAPAPRQRASRRRQDRHPRPRPAQARQARRGGVGGHEDPRDDRRVDAGRLALRASPARRVDRAHAPRALGRHRLPRAPARRGHPDRRPHLLDLRRVRRARVAAAAQGGLAGRGRARRDRGPERPPVRPAARRRVPGPLRRRRPLRPRGHAGRRTGRALTRCNQANPLGFARCPSPTSPPPSPAWTS